MQGHIKVALSNEPRACCRVDFLGTHMNATSKAYAIDEVKAATHTE